MHKAELLVRGKKSVNRTAKSRLGQSHVKRTLYSLTFKFFCVESLKNIVVW